MQTLKAIPAFEALFYVKNIADQFVILLAHLDLEFRRRLLNRAERFHHENGVMRDDRAPAFVYDRRMRDALGIAHVHDVPDDIVGVFLE